MGKVSKKKSRRDNRGSRRSNNDLESSTKKMTGENSSIILQDLNSMDLKKRSTAIMMFKDLLMQNLNNLSVVTKLTTNETLSSLSMRLIDSNSGIRQDAVRCFLAIARCGQKFAERIIDLGIHETIRKMLQEVSSSSSAADDEILDDLLRVVHLLTSHCPNTYSNDFGDLMSIALSNLTSHVSDSRRISFAEYVLNSSTNNALILSHDKIWNSLYSEIAKVVVTMTLSDESESSSNYFTVLLSAVMTNLLSSLPSLTLSEQLIAHILTILTDSLRIRQSLQHADVSGSSVDDSMVVDGSAAGEGQSHTVLASTATAANGLQLGKYKTLCMKTSVDALCHLYTERERTLDLDSTSPAPKKKNSADRAVLPSADFKALFSSSFNAFFSACLQSSAVLADSTCRARIQGAEGGAGGSQTVGSEDTASSVLDAAGLDFDDNTQDVLEAALSSLCTVADYASPSLADSSLGESLKALAGILEALYSALTLSLSQTDTAPPDARSDLEGDGEMEREMEMESIERTRFLTTSVCACLSSLLEHAPLAAFESLASAEEVQRLALILCRCASSSEREVSVPCIGAMGTLGAKNDQLEALRGTGFLPPKINWLLSNSILRVLDATRESERDSDSERDSALFLQEICLSSFIDLHSSDHPEVLLNFVKLKAIEKLTACLSVFEAAVRTVADQNRGKGNGKGKGKIQSGDSEANEREGDRDRDNEREILEALSDFEETVLNTRSFLEYKANYCR